MSYYNFEGRKVVKIASALAQECNRIMILTPRQFYILDSIIDDEDIVDMKEFLEEHAKKIDMVLKIDSHHVSLNKLEGD